MAKREDSIPLFSIDRIATGIPAPRYIPAFRHRLQHSRWNNRRCIVLYSHKNSEKNRKITVTAINFIRSVPQSFGSAFLCFTLRFGTSSRRELRNSFNFDFSENRKTIRKTESDNGSRLWYNVYTSQFCKKSKNTVKKVTNVTENKTLVNLWGFPLI